MDGIDQIFRQLHRDPLGSAPVIACLFTGSAFPSPSAAMPRSPEPAKGMPLGDDFRANLARAIGENPAVHDGATMIGRIDPEAPYRIMGWSYRLLPQPIAAVEPNHGSAFNSSIAMSAVAGVDRVYLVSASAAIRFEAGKALRL